MDQLSSVTSSEDGGKDGSHVEMFIQIFDHHQLRRPHQDGQPPQQEAHTGGQHIIALGNSYQVTHNIFFKMIPKVFKNPQHLN